MKRKIKNNSIIACLCMVAMGMMFSSCSDWTENENLKINIPNVETVDAHVYAKYLESLRNYKQTDHKMVYAWYDNSQKAPFNRSHHLTALPDSIDIVSLMYPDDLDYREIKEINSIRKDKGMKVVFTVDYEALRREFEKAQEENEQPKEEGETAQSEQELFVSFLNDKVDKSLALIDKYDYDGVSVKYNGKSTFHMTQEELETYTLYQNTYLNPVKKWHEEQPSKVLIFEGKPQNLIDRAFLQSCVNIVINGMSEVSVQGLAYSLEMAAVDNVPTDRFVIKVSALSLDPADTETGYFNQEYGLIAIPQTALWIAQPDTKYVKAGIGIYNIQNDFFNPTLTYPHTRTAINTLNPSPNN